ncbi:helix-turn-helix domain-containing protein [Nocardia sp. NPDC059180]|uniref:helix-turn-helix domain-containing protein n=1 Tax=Nocardia sp. NPDC059180 TaxID=3346761 RepID=UPI0036CBB7F6
MGMFEWTGIEIKAMREAALDLTQERFAERLGVDDRTVRNWERGTRLRPRYVARLDALRARLSAEQARRFDVAIERTHSTRNPVVTDSGSAVPLPLVGPTTTSLLVAHRGDYSTEISDMDRRELLRLLGLATAAVTTSIDWDRVCVTASSGAVDQATLDQYAVINKHLWQEFSSAKTKTSVFPAARATIAVLVDGLRKAHDRMARRRLCELAADVLQLAGESLFDGLHFTEAAHCYTLSAQSAVAAGAFDLHATALTRHAFLQIYDQRYTEARQMLEFARRTAQRGDSALSTRYWIDSVRAHAEAGLGEIVSCERSFECARGVTQLEVAEPTGWLRFDGERIDEDLASCHVLLGRPDFAEVLLAGLLDRPLSTRRRGGVLIDLAGVAALRNDPVLLASAANAAMEITRHTHSGYLARRLSYLRPRYQRLLADPHIAHLDRQIANLATTR